MTRSFMLHLLYKRLRKLGLKLSILLPLQIHDYILDAIKRFKMTGDPNGDPTLVDEDEQYGNGSSDRVCGR